MNWAAVARPPSIEVLSLLSALLSVRLLVHLRVEGIAALLIAKVASSEGLLVAGQTVGLTTGAAAKALAFDAHGLSLKTS